MPQLDLYLWFFNLSIFVSFFILSYYLFLYYFLIRLAKFFFFRKDYINNLMFTKFSLNFKLMVVVENFYYISFYIDQLLKLIDFNKKTIEFSELENSCWLSLITLKYYYLNNINLITQDSLIEKFLFLNEKTIFLKILLK